MQWEAEQEEGNDVTGPVDKVQLSSELHYLETSWLLSVIKRPKSKDNPFLCTTGVAVWMRERL